MKTIRAKEIDYRGVYYANITVSDTMKEAYDTLRIMEADGVIHGVKMGFDKVISLHTGSRTTNSYVANALQKQLEAMGLVVERNDCYNWFYDKEENDVDKYFNNKNIEKKDVEIICFQPRVGGERNSKPWNKGEPMGEDEQWIKKAEKGIFVR